MSGTGQGTPSWLEILFDPRRAPALADLEDREDVDLDGRAVVGALLRPGDPQAGSRTWRETVDATTPGGRLAAALERNLHGGADEALRAYLRLAQEVDELELATAASILAAVTLANGPRRRIHEAQRVLRSMLERVEGEDAVTVEAVLRLHLGVLLTVGGQGDEGQRQTDAAIALTEPPVGLVQETVAEVARWNRANFSRDASYPEASPVSPPIRLRPEWLASGQGAGMADVVARMVGGRRSLFYPTFDLSVAVLHDECIGDWAGQRRSRAALAHTILIERQAEEHAQPWPAPLFRHLYLSGDARLFSAVVQHVRREGPTGNLAEFLDSALRSPETIDTTFARRLLIAKAGDLADQQLVEETAESLWEDLSAGGTRYLRGSFATVPHTLRALSQLVLSMSAERQVEFHGRLQDWLLPDLDGRWAGDASRLLWHLAEDAWTDDLRDRWIRRIEADPPLPRPITNAVLLRVARRDEDRVVSMARELFDRNRDAFGPLLLDLDPEPTSEAIAHLEQGALEALRRELDLAEGPVAERSFIAGVPPAVTLAALLGKGHSDEHWGELVEYLLSKRANPQGRAAGMEMLVDLAEEIPPTHAETLAEGLADPEVTRDELLGDAGFGRWFDLEQAVVELRSKIDPEGLEERLVELASSGSLQRRAAAAGVLDRFPRWRTTLRVLLRDRSAEVRRGAAIAATRLVCSGGANDALRGDLLERARESGVAVPLAIAHEVQRPGCEPPEAFTTELGRILRSHPSGLVRRLVEDLASPSGGL